MSVIIEEVEVEVLPGQSAGGEATLPQPAEGFEAARTLDLLELVQERRERLACD